MLQVTIDGPVVCSGFTPDGGYLRRRRRMVVACRYSDERAGAATDLKSSGEPVFASVDWTVRTGGVHVASNTTLEGMFTGASAPRRW